MATTTHSRPNPDTTAADDMDLHSDNGLDFGDGNVDGDIELDLDPAPSTLRQDDDVSIDDAASVAAHEERPVPIPADQDDFMIDHEDLIEEDHVHQGDHRVIIADPTTTNNALEPQQTFAHPDDDLIDYSDDEDELVQKNTTVASEQAQLGVAKVDNQHLDAQQPEFQDDTAAYVSTKDNHVSPHSQPEQTEREADDGVHGGEINDHEPYSSLRQQQESGAYKSMQDSKRVDDDEIVLEEHEDLIHDHESQHSDHNDLAQEGHDHVDAVQSSLDLRPVTINYAGSELWLFKEHDTDNSGDWLLEDLSLAKSRMLELFQACRSALGDDVTNDSEIGFRFDHLHNLELFEDNTACVAVSLERLVGLYQQLQAQDGNEEPESFYISLQLRPRFATLLSEIARFAEQESGYIALEGAVAAGETHFSNVVSGHSTEHTSTEWDNEEQEETGQDVAQEADEDAEQEHDPAQHEDQEQEGYAEHEDAHTGPEQGGSADDDDLSTAELALAQAPAPGSAYSHKPLASSNGVSIPADQLAEADDRLEVPIPQPSVESAVESDSHREQKEDDLLDYSDDEGLEFVEQGDQASAIEPSPSSSTVQGDESNSATQDSHNLVEPESNLYEEAVIAVNNEDFDGLDDTTNLYQKYAQVYDQEVPLQGYQADPTEGFSVNPDEYNVVDQQYAGYEYNDLDQQLQLDFFSGTDFNNVDNTLANRDGFASHDNFLDLDNPADWVIDQEPTANVPEDAIVLLEEEDGAVEQPVLVTSPTANPVVALSNKSKDLSLQGQKRSMDEAGHGIDTALDSIDAKRPRV